MIRAQDVSAAIRFRSLLRGRLEIATLSATEPSINLVRNNQGRWNLASLLERNAQIPAAPTAKGVYERRPAFPYLEAGHARINFKLGQTKKSYALMDADVALWQDSENSWSARIKAAPVRTDFNLTDTGLLQINATWQRASSLRLTPVQFDRAMAERATRTDHQVAERKRRRMARRSKFHGERIRHSGSAADREPDRNRWFPSLRHCRQRERAPGNRLLGTVQRGHQHTCRPAVRIAGRRRDPSPARGVVPGGPRAQLRSDAGGGEGAADLRGSIAAPGEKTDPRRSYCEWIAECGVPRNAQRASCSRGRARSSCWRTGVARVRRPMCASHRASPIANTGIDEVAFGTIPLTLVAADSQDGQARSPYDPLEDKRKRTREEPGAR